MQCQAGTEYQNSVDVCSFKINLATMGDKYGKIVSQIRSNANVTHKSNFRIIFIAYIKSFTRTKYTKNFY